MGQFSVSWVSTRHISEVYTSLRNHNRIFEWQTKCLGVWVGEEGGRDAKQYQTMTESRKRGSDSY